MSPRRAKAFPTIRLETAVRWLLGPEPPAPGAGRAGSTVTTRTTRLAATGLASLLALLEELRSAANSRACRRS